MKDYLNGLSKLSSELTELAKQEMSSVQDTLDKTISTGLEIGKTSTESLMSSIDKSVDFIKNTNLDNLELSTKLTDTTKDIISTASDQIDQYKEKLTGFTSNTSTEESIPETKSNHEHLNQAIEKLKGKDKIGVLGEVLSGVGGGAAGAAAAGSIASAAGASTLLGSTSLASALGGVFVTTTPVGWVIGAAAVAGVAGYGIAKLVRSGSEQDQIREELIKRLEARITKARETGNNNDGVQLVEFKQLLSIALERNLVSDEKAKSMVSLIEIGSMKPETAILRLKSLISTKTDG